MKAKYSRLQRRKVYFVCECKCICLTSPDGQETSAVEIQELQSSQEEADTRMILHCLHVAEDSPRDSKIIVRSPDTDVFVLLLNFAQRIEQTVLFDTGTGNKRRLINVILSLMQWEVRCLLHFQHFMLTLVVTPLVPL
jgi:hypothetical protein